MLLQRASNGTDHFVLEESNISFRAEYYIVLVVMSFIGIAVVISKVV
jgi:hypothetical protein